MRSETFKPLIFRSISEYDAFQPPDGVPVLVNSMESQLKELVTIRNPQIPLKGEHDAIKTYINEHLAGQEIATYGLWVFYPWINTVVEHSQKQNLLNSEQIEINTTLMTRLNSLEKLLQDTHHK